jgi:hypothetical protein
MMAEHDPKSISFGADKKQILNRLATSEGHLRGIGRPRLTFSTMAV